MDDQHSGGSFGIQEIQGCLIAQVDKHSDEDGLIGLKREILNHLARGRFRGVIINVSQTLILGSYGAAILMETAHAVEMMGSAAVFVGFRPGVAAALVEFGLYFSGIKTAVTTADAFALLPGGEAENGSDF